MIKRLIDSLVTSISRFSLYEEMSFYAVAKGKNVGIYSTWYVDFPRDVNLKQKKTFLSGLNVRIKQKAFLVQNLKNSLLNKRPKASLVVQKSQTYCQFCLRLPTHTRLLRNPRLHLLELSPT